MAEFGVTRKQPAGSAVLQSIHATVAKVTPDAVGHVYVLLDNGQTWTFTDTDLHVERGDVVTIERGAFGSFTMTTPSRHSYKVRRLP